MILSSIGLYSRLNSHLTQDNMDGTTRVLFGLYLGFMLIYVSCCVFALLILIMGGEYNLELYHNFLGLVFLLGGVCTIVGFAADLRLADANHRANLSIIRTLINMVEARDVNLKGHSQHVAAIVMLIYRNLPSHVRKRYNDKKVEYAALLHDVGKLGVPEEILNKPGKLTELEWDIMRQHPAIARSILESVPSLSSILDWICFHHERADGNGYYGLTSEQTPFISKLIAVADTYSALVMCRSYKPELEHHEAMRVMADNVGTQLDPYLFEVFNRVARDQVDDCMALLCDVDCTSELLSAGVRATSEE